MGGKHILKTPQSQHPNSKLPTETCHVAAMSASARNAQDVIDQQRLLDVFTRAFRSLLASERLNLLLQEVKQALYRRDFVTAFGKNEYLEAYAARWSPTRALCYAALFSDISNHIVALTSTHLAQGLALGTKTGEKAGMVEGGQAKPSVAAKAAPIEEVRMLSIGGGAAELVAFASFISKRKCKGYLNLLDSAPWAPTLALLEQQLVSKSQDSSQELEISSDTTKLLLQPSQLLKCFTQEDVLSSPATFQGLDSDKPLLTTLLFTLNELYTHSGIGKMTSFLRSLSLALQLGSLLLIVDSPGSYSETAVGKEKRQYPMHWLLEITLLGAKSDQYTWKRLESCSSQWFRVPETLRYPIKLENMRYQMHLYRKEKHRSTLND